MLNDLSQGDFEFLQNFFCRPEFEKWYHNCIDNNFRKKALNLWKQADDFYYSVVYS